MFTTEFFKETDGFTIYNWRSTFCYTFIYMFIYVYIIDR